MQLVSNLLRFALLCWVSNAMCWHKLNIGVGDLALLDQMQKLYS